MVYTIDYSSLIATHVESGADITMLYHAVDNAKESYLNCKVLNLNKQKGVLSLEPNPWQCEEPQYFHGYICDEDGTLHRSRLQGP